MNGPVSRSGILVAPGERAFVARAVTEEDAARLAGLADHPREAHLAAGAMARARIGLPVAHGALLVGPRHDAPVRPGDTVTTCQATRAAPARHRPGTRSQRGETVAAALRHRAWPGAWPGAWPEAGP